MSSVLCEVAIDSLDGVLAAERGGADRLELCQALELGGLTPSAGFAACAREATRLPLFAILRPRPGDFVLDPSDLRVLVAEIEALRRCGVDGFVAGALSPDGSVDRVATRELLAAAAPLPLTFHRAFDVSRDVCEAFDALVELGVPRVLTSGGAPEAAFGLGTLRELVVRAQARRHGGSAITVLAGGGIRRGNVRRVVDESGVSEVHLSAATIVDGPMRWRGAALSFPAPGREPFERRATSADEVRAVVEALRNR